MIGWYRYLTEDLGKHDKISTLEGFSTDFAQDGMSGSSFPTLRSHGSVRAAPLGALRRKGDQPSPARQGLSH